MIRTQVQLEQTQYHTLKELAALQHVSVAELIRQAVNSLLATTGLISREERRQRALSIVGRFRSGKTDVSQRHDDYLAEAYGIFTFDAHFVEQGFTCLP